MNMIFSYQEALSSSMKYFNGDELAARVFVDKYSLRNNEDEILEDTPEKMHLRIAKEISRIEKNKFNNPLSEELIFSYLDHFKKIIPQGSCMFGIGNPYHYVTLSNCYVIEPPADSYGGICKTDEQLLQISKRRGGNGTDISYIRPAGMMVKNSSRTTTGIIPFMRRFSNSIREVGQGGRRGALMLTISVHHPQVLDFASIKNNLNEITGANISIRLTDEFLTAVQNDGEYEQRWPVDSKKPKISKMVKAKDIWKEIVKNAHNMAEPGLLFWDTIIKESPADCYSDQGFTTISTNPCSEIPLPAFDSCRLIVINLLSYVENPFTEKSSFNYNSFFEDCKIMQRLMDDIVDLEIERIDKIINKIEKDPEPKEIKEREYNLWIKVREMAINGRRTGCGITALGDTLAALNIRYCSEESLKVVNEIYKTLKLGCYWSSVEMAKELGHFPVWNHNLERNNPFLLRIKEEDVKLWEEMKKYGRRNIALLTTAPTGTVSILTQTTSGIEPLFQAYYIRRKKITHDDKNARIDFVDNMGDKWHEFPIIHSKLLDWMVKNINLLELNQNNSITSLIEKISKETLEKYIKQSPWFNCCAEDLNWVDRVKLQSMAQKHIDHAISSCLAKDSSMIQTSKGLFKIEELVDKDCPESQFCNIKDEVSSVNINNQISKISQGYNNGVKSCIKLELSYGNEIIGTPNHKLAVLSNKYELIWKSLEEIEVGDYIVGRKGLCMFPDDIRYKTLTRLNNKVLSYHQHTNSKNISVPQKMSGDLARLLGYLCSDASVGKNGITLCQQQNNVIKDFIERMQRLFNIKPYIHQDKRANNLFNITFNSREISHFFTWLGITNHDTIEVPKIIRLSTKSYIKEFIRGATLDGYVSEQHLCVATSVSRKYLSQLQAMLMNFGIIATIVNSHKEGKRTFPNGRTYMVKKSFSLIICESDSSAKFLRDIGFAEKRKNKEGKSKFKRSYRIIRHGALPDFGIRKAFREEILPNIKSDKFYKYFSIYTKSRIDGQKIDRSILVEMSDFGFKVPDILIDKTYYFSEVKCKKYTNKYQTYDLSVPDGNSYIANSLISHNTINLPENVSVNKVAEIYETAWKSGCKGITIYRKNCRTGVLVEDNKNKSKQTFKYNNAPKRPKILDGKLHFFTVKGEKYYVAVGLFDSYPYEIFTGFNSDKKEDFIPKDAKNGIIIKNQRGDYTFIDNINKEEYKLNNGHSDPSAEALTRIISCALRHGSSLDFIVHQLEKTTGDLTSFSKCLARTLKSYISDGSKIHGETCSNCNSSNIQRDSGCYVCKDCGESKCK